MVRTSVGDGIGGIPRHHRCHMAAALKPAIGRTVEAGSHVRSMSRLGIGIAPPKGMADGAE